MSIVAGLLPYKFGQWLGVPMTLKLVPIDHGELCHGWAWSIDDEDALAEQVARIVLGQYRHVAKILSGAGVPGPAANAEQATAAIKQLTLAEGDDPWHRDGWLFQAISWIAAHQQPAASLTRMPHIRKADVAFPLNLRRDAFGREWTKHGGHAARFLFATVSRPSRTAA
ncbi:hypothetical protein PXK18_17690, partial [Phaeobacter gallaeciensis]|nr:hypothetical protein [Phaeobacter gallaeciensis]